MAAEQILKVPFDGALILRKKRAIKRALLERDTSAFAYKKIAVLGGSTTSEIKEILELFLLNIEIKPTFFESEFGKYYEDVMFSNPELYEFKPDIIFVHTTSHNVSRYPTLTDSAEQCETTINEEFSRFTQLWQRMRDEFGCAVLQNNFEFPCTRVLGNLEGSDPRGRIHFLTKLNVKFAEYAHANAKFLINDINYLSSWAGLERWHDESCWHSYKYALSFDLIPLLAHNVAQIIGALCGKSKKCLVLDLDNTVWGGVIGDEGVDGIQIGKETAVAEGFTAFQQYVKALRDRGVILAVASKNDFANAKAGFFHPDSILKFEDFACFKANWEPKDANIRDAALEINIGLDSMVFIDDNPVERDLIRQQLPIVEVPEVGTEVARFARLIDQTKFFEPVAISAEDLKRGSFYTSNLLREDFKSNFGDYGSFLKSLEMRAEIMPFSPIYMDRITQLINKTNQFNLTTRRFSLPEVDSFAGSSEHLTLYGRLSDKFGDNGLVTVFIGEKKGDTLDILLWLMSCRVLKRNMEHALFDEVVRLCREQGIHKIEGRYIKTTKNSMVAGHYERLEFSPLRVTDTESEWIFEIPPRYTNKNTYIEVTNGKQCDKQ